MIETDCTACLPAARKIVVIENEISSWLSKTIHTIIALLMWTHTVWGLGHERFTKFRLGLPSKTFGNSSDTNMWKNVMQMWN